MIIHPDVAHPLLIHFPDHSLVSNLSHTFSGVRDARSLMVCGSFFVLFLFAIALSVLLRFTASDYPFDTFKPFLSEFWLV